MTTKTGLDVFEKTIHKSNEWLSDLMGELHTEDRKYAYRVLRATLHALRDRLIPDEAVDLGAQLPMLIRGFYYEGWTPNATPTDDDREAFFERVSEEMSDQPGVPDPDRWIRAVFNVMANRLDVGELQNITDVLPDDFQALWPERIQS
ncbi:MAG: DUF2267 domain-containing protein [Gemmatimonadetes bacterium]|nr:DUF2267 domain-containing protein [Gemmatimonadota bacterium]